MRQAYPKRQISRGNVRTGIVPNVLERAGAVEDGTRDRRARKCAERHDGERHAHAHSDLGDLPHLHHRRAHHRDEHARRRTDAENVPSVVRSRD